MLELNSAAKAAKLLGMSGTQRRDFFVAYNEPSATFDPVNRNQDAFTVAVCLGIGLAVHGQLATVSHSKIDFAVSHKSSLATRTAVEKAARCAILKMVEHLYQLEFGE